MSKLQRAESERAKLPDALSLGLAFPYAQSWIDMALYGILAAGMLLCKDCPDSIIILAYAALTTVLTLMNHSDYGGFCAVIHKHKAYLECSETGGRPTTQF